MLCMGQSCPAENHLAPNADSTPSKGHSKGLRSRETPVLIGKTRGADLWACWTPGFRSG